MTSRRNGSSSSSSSSSSHLSGNGAGGGADIVKFQCFSSNAQVSFWQELAKLKIDVLGLDQTALDITGIYSIAPSTITQGLPSRFSVGIESFHRPQHATGSLMRECRTPGVLKNFNTDEAFRTFDKNAWLQSLGSQIWGEILDGEAVKNPTRLLRFSILCFADIKRNAFIYWFAFPAVVSNPPVRHLRPPTLLAGNGSYFSEAECLMLHAGLKAFRRLRSDQTKDPYCSPFFLVIRSMVISPTLSGGSSSSLSLEVAPLETYEKLSEGMKNQSSVIFGFIDPSTVPLAPGWPLRNFLILLANRWRLTKATILCYRGRIERLEQVSTEGLSPSEASEAVGSSFVIHAALCPMTPANPSESSLPPPIPSTVGWELNKGKNMPRRMDLSSMMDPTRLAESSVDLNLKLMRWRLLPSLDVALLAKTRCLLIGAGTLGCGVARCLLGWGVRTITLIDNGKVALSNPVRQSLFEFSDCSDGGKLKASAAAEALKRISPGVTAEGHVMTIPMPGHPLASPGEVQTAQREVTRLDELVLNHDVIYLLTDTRESRWLPTVMAAAHDKMLINAALGFDTFMVMRHGGAIQPGEEENTQRIGCYFCNDVVAPDDSTKDRTLDQQCTVTRPGLAQVASALAVELMVALLHHPKHHHAPADTAEDAANLAGRLDDPEKPLGILPQQIRGFLSHFTTILPVTRAFNHCTGCCQAIVSEYQSAGFDLVLKACNSNHDRQNYLEELTGLAKMRKEVDEVDMLWLDEDEDDEEVGEQGEDQDGLTNAPEAQLSPGNLSNADLDPQGETLEREEEAAQAATVVGKGSGTPSVPSEQNDESAADAGDVVVGLDGLHIE